MIAGTALFLVPCVAGLLLLAAAAHAYQPDVSGFPVDKAVFPGWLENMRAGQVRDAVAQEAVCLLPVGTLESCADQEPLGIGAAAYRSGMESLAADRKAVIAPPIWYAPTGYVLGGPSDGTFHMAVAAFWRYLAEVLFTLGEVGFSRIEVVLVHNPQGKAGPLHAACKLAEADIFNNLWKDPRFGRNWWIRPDRDRLEWARYSLRELPDPKAAKHKIKASRKATSVRMELPLRLEHMRPSQLRQAVAKGLCCLVPVGVIENHGNQNPVGCDAIEAQDPVVLAASEAPAVVAPTIWYGPTGFGVTGPDLATTDISAPAFAGYMAGVVGGLAAMGFKNIIFVQVHQGSAGPEWTSIELAIAEFRCRLHQDGDYGFGWGLKEPCRRNAPNMEVIAPPHGQYDHAGKNETSWMLHLRGQYTDLGMLRPGDYPFCWHADGEADKATAEWGRQMTEKAVDGLVQLIRARTAPPTEE